MRTTLSMDVAAPPEVVFRLSRDVTRWATILPHYARSRAVRRETDGAVIAEFVARRPLVPVLGLGLPVAWRSRTWAEPENRRLRFVHLGGLTAGMDVTWRIDPVELHRDGRLVDGARVTIEHAFARRLPIPILGGLVGDAFLPAFVDRFFTRPIASRTLATFGALAEALAGTSEMAAAPKGSS